MPHVTYSSYLRLDELLQLQTPAPGGTDHDEMLFIVVHQVYELWFKQILHELDHLLTLLDTEDDTRVRHTLKRVLTILKVLVAQLDILETMTPLEFLAFRDRLESGSGFQSFQFRAIEFALGLKRASAVTHYPEGSTQREWLQRRLETPSVWHAFLRFIVRRGYPVPAELISRDVREPTVASAEFQQTLIRIYRTDSSTAEICERLVDLDEGVQEWRYRHVKMVERTIGMRSGTGGSSGAAYLRNTIANPAFPDLWEIRSEL
ncbi:MAG TPA: tryptophan 2,3-dioxygenase family protein [Longimicrobiales bacterium]|nr:tryptophan 2,3-dioxygenase family protein [Longimicrobiales bacterium]